MKKNLVFSTLAVLAAIFALAPVQSFAVCIPSPSGIVAWWPGEGTVSDIAGTNNGLAQGALGYTNGVDGLAFVFDNSTSYIAVPASSSLDVGTGSGLTIEAWIQPSAADVGGSGGPIVEWDSASTDGAQLWANNALSVNLKDTVGTAHAFSSANNIITSTNWQHIALTYNKSNGFAWLYRNGNAVASNHLGTFTPQTSYPLNIGRRTGQPIGLGSTFGGFMDELAIYNRALTKTEITAIYNAGSAGKCNSAGLAPTITAQPTNFTVTVSNTAVFSVTANGTAPLTYKWQFGSNNVPVGTNATLTLPNVQLAQAGNYSVLVSNLYGFTNSSVAVLTVQTPPPPSCTPPASGIVAWWPGQGDTTDIIGGNPGTLVNGTGFSTGEVGNAFNLNGGNNYVLVNPAASGSLDAGAGSGLTFEEWIKPNTVSTEELLIEYERALGTPNGSDVGATMAIHATGILIADVVGASGGSHLIASPANLLTAGIWQHISLTYDKASGQAMLYINGASVMATNLGSFTPQTSFTNIVLGARTTFGSAASPVVPFSGLMDEVSFYNRALSSNEIVAIYNAGSAGKCAPVAGMAPVITAQPTNLTVTVSNTAVFAVTVHGTAPLTYQWKFGSNNLVGRTNATLTLPNVQLSQAGNYSVLISNFYGFTNSAVAVLTVQTQVPPPSCTPPASGIVAWWPGQGSGVDVIGGNNATVPAGVTYAAAEVGQGFNFDGTQFLVVSNQPVFNPTNAITVECWAYTRGPSRPDTWAQHLVTKDSECGPTRQYLLTINDSQVQSGAGDFCGAIYLPGGVALINGARVVQSNTWYHVAMTYDGAELKLYVNGALDGHQAATGPITVDTQPVRIGGGSPGGCDQYNMNGLIDEPTIYNRALSSNEIAAIFNAGSAGKCAPVVGMAPVITAQPTNLTVTVSNTAVFTVAAQGTAPLIYQWKFGSNNLAGRTNATLTLPNVQLAQAGNYSVLVSNLYGFTNSAIAVLTVQTQSPPPSCTPPASGIVAWWQAEGNTLDRVGNVSGTLVNGAGFSAGKVGTAFDLSAANSYVLVSGAPNVNLSSGTGLTVEGWINPADATTPMPIVDYERVLGSSDPADSGDYFYISIAPPTGTGPGCLVAKLQGTNGVIQDIYSGPGLITAGVWQHVALTYNQASGAAMFYLNGTSVAQTNLGSFVPETTFSNLLIGAHTIYGSAASPSEKFSGQLDEISLYNRALSSNEIAAIYQAGSAGKCGGAIVTSTGVPAIFNVSPASAVAGTTVTIFGTNFSTTAASNVVYFGAVKASVGTASPTSLTVAVPVGATYAPVTVTVNGMTAWANSAFMPTFNTGGSNVLTLAPPLDLPTGNNPGQTTFADVDGDGKPDLIVNSSQNFISIYRNRSTNGALIGLSSFAPRVDVPMPGNVQNCVLADVDGDGKLDMVIVDRDISMVHVLKNFATPGNITSNAFILAVNLHAGSDPRGIVVRDLDGDGLPDIAVANWGDSTVMAFHNLGTTNGITTNSFAAPVVFGVDAQPQDLKAADLDGDGKPDLVTANNNTSHFSLITLLRNTSSPGAISFASKLSLPGNRLTAYCLAIGDLDGDGRPDIVVSSFDQGHAVSVYRHTSSVDSLANSSFDLPVDFVVPGWGNGVAIGDLDGDGKPDLAVVTQLDDGLTIFRNTSTPGSFDGSSLRGVSYPAGYNPNGVAIGDLNGAGRPDIAFGVSYAANATIYQNLTVPVASTPSTNPPVITSLTPPVGALGTSITIAGNYFSPVAGSNIVYFGAVKASVATASPTSLTVTVPAGAVFGPVTVTVGGLTAYSAQMFEPTFTGNGSNITTSSFAPSFNIATTGGPGSTVIADLDGDGKPDLAFVTDANIISILRNISTNGAPLAAASFAPAVNLPIDTNGISGNPYRMKAVDLDGDGKLDLIAVCVNGNRVTVFHNVSTPGTITTSSFEAPFALIAGADCRTVTVGDLDADGRVDIVGLNYGDSTLSLFKNIGTPGVLNASSFASQAVVQSPGGPYEAAVADLDGDGKPDLAVCNTQSASISVFKNVGAPGALGAGTFAAPVNFASGSTPQTIAAVDLDGDGKLDLVVGSVLSYEVNVYRNLSAGGVLNSNSFAPEVDFGTPGWMHTVSVADFNGDGKPDIGVVGELDSYMAIFQNTATPGSFTTASFAPIVTFGTGWNAWSIAAGDLDGDGRPDIVFCNYYDHNIQIYQNAMPFGTPTFAPVITAQPTNLTVNVNGTAVFNVVATGTPSPTYQWSINGTNILGATSATLTLTNVQPAQGGTYSVLVANTAGSVTSSNALLTVVLPPAPPVILSQTPSQVVLVGSPATFSVTAGGYPLNYFWSRNGAVIPNATNAFYTLANAQLSDSGSKFSCLVSNALGLASSTNALLKVIDTISNDLCSGAVFITSYSYTNVQSTAMASSYGDPQPDCVGGFGNGVWYEFTAPVNGLLSVDTFGSDFDTGLGAYVGTCDALTEVACDDDTLGVTSQVILQTTAGTTYSFLAGGYGGHVGNLVFHLNYFTPPHFDVQPTNLAVVISSNAIFSPTISGAQPMSFQWYFNNAPLADGGRISGSTNSMLTVANVQTNDGGNYQVVASNFVGVTTSSVAVLTPVILPPFFTQLPVSQAVGAGSNATFSAAVGGTAPYTYQWYLNNNPLTDDGVYIAGSMTTSLTISNITSADGGSYSLTAANAAGATNASATLTVLLPPVITTQPISRSVPPGLPTTFATTVSGNPTGYQWLLNGTNVPGANSTVYSVPAVGSNDLGSYQLVASNAIGTVVSSPALLTFGPVAAWGRNQAGESLPPPNLSGVVSVGGQSLVGMALRTNGTFVSWGSGSITNIPASVTNVVAFSLFDQGQAVALRADGTVVVWSNGSGAVPAGATNIVAVASGGNAFEMCLRADGSVVGLGNPPYAFVPAGLNNVVSIACGYAQSIAARKDGTVTAWGIGTATNVPAGMTNIVSVAAGNNFFLALRNNGTVAAWGVGSSTNVPAGLSNVAAIYTGANNSSANFSIAVRSDGTIVTWGNNTFGQTNPPAALSNLLSVAAAAATDHGLALVNDGSPQILTPPVGLTAYVGRDVTLPVKVAGAQPLSFQWLMNGTNLPGATNASLLLKNIQLTDAGSYQLFVSNSIGSVASLPVPVKVITSTFLSFLGSVGITASNVYQGGTEKFYSAPVLGNGPLRYQWYWGPTNKNWLPVVGGTNDILTLDPALAVQSGYYYLGVSNLVAGTTSAPVNIRVQFARAWGYQAVSNPPVNITNAIAVATGGSANSANGHYLALSADGKVSAWANVTGFVLYGETNVSALSNSFVTAIAASYQHSLALKSDGTVYGFGYGAYGQTNIPPGLNNVVAISCGGYHDLALKSDGTVVGWGANGVGINSNYGQTTNNPAATNVVAISAGQQHSLALRADGTLVAWGYLFDGSTTIPLTATNIVAIAAGSGYNLALRANGTVVQWGNAIANYPVPSTLSNVVAISAAGMHGTALRNDGTVVSWGNELASPAANNTPADVANVIALSSGGDHDFALLGNRAPTFTVQPWNRAITPDPHLVSSITLAGKVVGVQPMKYQWRLNGTNFPGGTNDTLVLTYDAPHVPSGTFQLVASNAYGVTISKPAKVSIVIPLGVALNATNLNLITSGNAQWYGQTNITHDGVSAARSGGIGPLQETIMQTTVSNGSPGNIAFWWKVSSEQFFDILEFRVNGTTMASISGEVDWQQATIPVNAGTNVLQWRYSKDSSFDSGLDAGFVDQYGFAAAPQIVVQPLASLSTNQGATVKLSVVATGPPSMGYQWWQNGNPVGNNSSTLMLNNVGRAQDGAYCVTVSNPGGAVVSSNAMVHVTVPQVLGAPTVLPDGSLQFTSSDLGGGALTDSDLPNFEAQGSTDLVNWVTLPNALSITNGALLLQDGAHTNYPSRYYRVVEH